MTRPTPQRRPPEHPLVMVACILILLSVLVVYASIDVYQADAWLLQVLP